MAIGRRGYAVFLAVCCGLLAGGAAGCGGDSSAHRVTSSDVTGLPPGTATGTALSGQYLLVTASITACDCRVGSCSGFRGDTGAIVEVAQQDGMLTITDPEGQVATGGVDANGTFKCGGENAIPAAAGQGVTYETIQGSFTLAGTQPTGMDLDINATITGTVEGVSYDCDIAESGTAVHEMVAAAP